jgi:hypothetical protein
VPGEWEEFGKTGNYKRRLLRFQARRGTAPYAFPREAR